MTVKAAGYPGNGSRILGQSASAVSHTGDTTNFALATVTLPAGSMGANGRIEIDAQFSYPSSANNKTLQLKFGGTNYRTLVATTTTSANLTTTVMNRNATNSQVGTITGTGGLNAGASASPVTSSIDTTADVTISINCTLASAAETVTLEYYCVKLFPG